MDSLAVRKAPRRTSSRFYNVPEVSKIMGVPESTVYELSRRKRIGGLVRFGRHVRFDKTKFEAWLESGGEAGQKAA